MKKSSFILVFLSFSLFLPALAGSATDTVYYEVWDIASLEQIGGHDVTVYGDPVVENTELGDAIRFDGTEDQLIVDFNPLMDAKSFTIELVFKPDACYPENTDPRFVHIQDPNDPEGKRVLIELRVDYYNRCYMDGFMRTDIESLTLKNDTLVHPTETWHHLAITYNDSILTTYFNGVEELSGKVRYDEYIVNPTGKTSLGARMNMVTYYSGLMKTLKITHACLEPDDFIFIHDTPATFNGIHFSSSSLDIYPNPAGEQLKIKLEDNPGYDTDKELRIFDLAGKQIFYERLEPSAHGSVTINLHGFAEGMYLINYRSGNKSYNNKISVIH